MTLEFILQFVDRVYPSIYKKIRKLKSTDSEDFHDIKSLVYITVYKSLHRINACAGSWETYVSKIIKNTIVTYIKNLSKEPFEEPLGAHQFLNSNGLPLEEGEIEIEDTSTNEEVDLFLIIESLRPYFSDIPDALNRLLEENTLPEDRSRIRTISQYPSIKKLFD